MKERLKIAVGTVLCSVLATACGSSTVDTSPPNQAERRFQDRANTSVILPGEVHQVVKLKDGLGSSYDQLHVVDQFNNVDNSLDNSLTLKPQRYSIGEEEYTDKVPDVACENLSAPFGLGVKRVRAVYNTGDEAPFVAFDQNGQKVHICYNTSDHPGTVAVWGEDKIQ